MTDVIRISDNYADLKGIGTEYVAKNGEVIAKFYDGQLARPPEAGNSEEPTLKAA